LRQIVRPDDQAAGALHRAEQRHLPSREDLDVPDVRRLRRRPAARQCAQGTRVLRIVWTKPRRRQTPPSRLIA
jgi:hypothetical protein